MVKKIQEWQKRILEERNELKDRLDKLESFLDSGAFIMLDDENKRLLVDQKTHMTSYECTLSNRIALW